MDVTHPEELKMIKTLKFKFGRAPGVPPEVIDTPSITVFVGPNNAGKSKVLSEIQQFCHNGKTASRNVILDNIEFENLSEDEAKSKIEHVTLNPGVGETLRAGHILVGKKDTRHQVLQNEILNALKKPNTHHEQFCRWYLLYNTLFLGGTSRMNLISAQNAGNLQVPPKNTLQVLFRDNAKREEVRRIIYDSLGFYFVIDPTNLGQLQLRFSGSPPSNEIEEKGIHDDAVQFHSRAKPITETSDGVRAFTGMIMEVIAGDPSVLLIDEPEAFLHPSLSFTLGKEVAIASNHSGKRLFVSTHSSNFVMGCIHSGVPVNIVRLTYSNNIPTVRVLPSDDILHLMRNPLLRSTGTLGGLFFEFVIVTEADTDRAFYQEINERLLRYNPELGIPNCLFLNAQNKQTVKTIIKPLRELGIPVVGIVDIDILKDGGKTWSTFLESGFIPPIEHGPLASLRSEIKRKIEDTGKDMKKNGGIELLNPDDKEAANNLFDKLGEYGLFVVRKGELESWLSQMGVGAGKHGPSWLIDIFEKMGEDPDANGYLKPTSGDVWDFMGELKKWLTSPTRKGIPS